MASITLSSPVTYIQGPNPSSTYQVYLINFHKELSISTYIQNTKTKISWVLLTKNTDYPSV